MRAIVTILRVFAAIILALLWVGLFPIYSDPFAGCDSYGYLTLQEGCSNWPQFFRGFGFVLIAAVIAPSRIHLHYVAIVVIGIATLFGGFEGLRLGGHFDVHSLNDLAGQAFRTYHLFVGGLLALLLFLGVKLVIEGHETNSTA